MKTAFSLIRFSSWGQIKGDSQRRQAEWSAQWIEKHPGYILDASLKSDRPTSAFRGANRRKGAVAQILGMVEQGMVPKGSVLLVESLDRLSRQDLDEAITLFLGILGKGVEIATRTPERHYTKSSVKDLVGIVEPILIMSRANEESVMKSKRIAEEWGQRRQKAGKDTPMFASGPSWLKMEGRRKEGKRMVGGKWVVDETKAAAVRRIFQLALAGRGLHSIARTLNEEGFPPIGRGPDKARKEQGAESVWHFSYVRNILTNRAVLGELQPYVKDHETGKKVPEGKSIPDYYPRVVSDRDFYAVQGAMAKRKLPRGPHGKQMRNLFTGILKDARDGENMVVVREVGEGRNAITRLVSGGARRGKKGTTYRAFPYEIVERCFLSFVNELKPEEVMPQAHDPEDGVATLKAKLADVDRRITLLNADLQKSGDFTAGLGLLRKLEGDKVTAQAELEKVKVEKASPRDRSLADTQTIAQLLAGTEGEELTALRTRLKMRIRELVAEMWLLVLPKSDGVQVAYLQVVLSTGTVYHIPILRHQGIAPGELLPSTTYAKGEMAYRNLSNYRADEAVRNYYEELHRKKTGDARLSLLPDREEPEYLTRVTKRGKTLSVQLLHADSLDEV